MLLLRPPRACFCSSSRSSSGGDGRSGGDKNRIRRVHNYSTDHRRAAGPPRLSSTEPRPRPGSAPTVPGEVRAACFNATAAVLWISGVTLRVSRASGEKKTESVPDVISATSWRRVQKKRLQTHPLNNHRTALQNYVTRSLTCLRQVQFVILIHIKEYRDHASAFVVDPEKNFLASTSNTMQNLTVISYLYEIPKIWVWRTDSSYSNNITLGMH